MHALIGYQCESLAELDAKGDVAYAQVAELFDGGEASVSRLLRRERGRGHLDPDAIGGGYPPRIADDHLPLLIKLVAEKPDRTLGDLCKVWGDDTTRSCRSRAWDGNGVRTSAVRRSSGGREACELDNLRAHHAPEVRQAIEAVGANVLDLPPYSPDHNPIELCWSFAKAWLRRLAQRTGAGLRKAINNTMLRVRGDQLVGWFRHSGFGQRE